MNVKNISQGKYLKARSFTEFFKWICSGCVSTECKHTIQTSFDYNTSREAVAANHLNNTFLDYIFCVNNFTDYEQF